MKRFFLTLCIFAQCLVGTTQGIIDVASYNMNGEHPFTYSHTFPGLTYLIFNIPFASQLNITGGNHLEFTIDYDSFYFHLIRKTGLREDQIGSNYAEQYVDFTLVDFYNYNPGSSVNLVYETDTLSTGRSYYRVNWNASSGHNITANSLGGSCAEHILRVHYYK